MSATALQLAAPLETDQHILMYGLRWSDYEVLLALRGDRPVPRLAYLEGTVELMSPSIHHERIKKFLARLLEAWAEECGIRLDGYGSWTVKNPFAERGLEPDECYSVGPPGERPDLAIEVIWTSGGIDKLRIYAGLGVPEVWRWENGALTVHVLRGEAYERSDRSVLLPDLDLDGLVAHLQGEDQTAAVRAWRRSLRG